TPHASGLVRRTLNPSRISGLDVGAESNLEGMLHRKQFPFVTRLSIVIADEKSRRLSEPALRRVSSGATGRGNDAQANPKGS
ncbi:MAG: hypothetical protein QNJ02_16735, partial [Desulfobacterales bacterium]|nr:hypothetical protein [Desulfobacterales bacterium]